MPFISFIQTFGSIDCFMAYDKSSWPGPVVVPSGVDSAALASEVIVPSSRASKVLLIMVFILNSKMFV
jgi:hypothetical protein